MGKVRIGIFDSGIGGLAVARKIRLAFPDFDIKTVNDSNNVPYGTRTDDEIIKLTGTAIQPLIKKGCDPIVFACNTASAVSLEHIRAKYPAIKFIGLEPMIKTAAKISGSKKIVMCATPATLKSNRYQRLKKMYAGGVKVLEPDCSSWAYMIEKNDIDRQKINKTVTQALNDGADLIVLGCTHYHWIEDYLAQIAENKAMIVEPSAALIRMISKITGYEPAKDFTDCINCSPRSL